MRSVRVVFGCVALLASLASTAHAHPYPEKRDSVRMQRDAASSRYYHYDSNRPATGRSVGAHRNMRLARGYFRTST